MSQYAQIVDGIVTQLSPTDGSSKHDIWVFCTHHVKVGWQYSDFTFTPPPPAPPEPTPAAATPAPQTADLQAALVALLAALNPPAK